MEKVTLSAVVVTGLFNLTTTSAQSSTGTPAVDYHQSPKIKFIEGDGIRYAYQVSGNEAGNPMLI